MIEGKITLDVVLYDGTYVDEVVERILGAAKVRGVFAVDGADWTTVHRCKDCGTADGVQGYEDPRVTESFGYSQMIDVWLCTPCVTRWNEQRRIKPAGTTGESNNEQDSMAQVRDSSGGAGEHRDGGPPFDYNDGEGVHPGSVVTSGEGHEWRPGDPGAVHPEEYGLHRRSDG